MSRSIVLVLAWCVALAGRLGAQVVRGEVVDSGTARPVVGVIVILLDDHGVRRAGALTDDAGRFAVRAPAPGRYTLRLDRIGYASSTSPPLALGAGETVARRLTASAIPISLAALTVRGDDRCRVRPGEGERSFALWREARKVLEAANLSAESGRVEARVRRYVRLLDPYTLAVRHEESAVTVARGERPFVAARSPEELARDGYARRDERYTTYYAPDAEVLLSDPFAATHCFRALPPDDDHRGLVGLAFEPARKRKLPDVKGVLWLDARTGALTRMEFRHTNLFPQVPPSKYGGELDFARLPSGAWIVRRWWLRFPLFTGSAQAERPEGDMRELGIGKLPYSGFREEGGEVLTSRVTAAADSLR
ncbi:MAG TPA: carboxypeptidase-like regulatory domain-containing protein [Gemmatimonadaceae bacterium]